MSINHTCLRCGAALGTDGLCPRCECALALEPGLPETKPAGDVVGTFTTSGALTISGVATMDVGLNANGEIAHCVVTLIPSDGSGTITIHQECEFATSPPKGQWEIVDGTGDYADLKGNGSLLMPPATEAM